MSVIGLGKTLFNSSVCLFYSPQDFEIALTERITRKKGSGAWPSEALKKLNLDTLSDTGTMIENRDVDVPADIEQRLNLQFPFFESLQKLNLHHYSRHFNPQVQFSSHHLCHANAAAVMSPFAKAIILVIDGAGSRLKHLTTELELLPGDLNLEESAEERSVYLLDNGNLKCVEKKAQTFEKHGEHYYSQGLGSFYEKISEYVFNSKRSAGKVMGLAALGKSQGIASAAEFLRQLDWKKQYGGKSKQDWESSSHMKSYQDVSASVQTYFEQDYIGFIKSLREKFGDYPNLIITGGCALNCTSNMKLYELGLFDSIYVPPFPGDESISLGAATIAYKNAGNTVGVFSNETQHGYFGLKTSVPDSKKIESLFADFEIFKPGTISGHCAELLNDGKIIGWFQGRSESGPRALGNRSILARPDRPGLKDFLNSSIKFREAFRPYGCSALFEKSHEYFKVPQGFENPYMSFATMVNVDYCQALKEVSHVDGTSRMQTVRQQQNPLFYKLISEFGNKSGLYCLLNTSLNVMGEPIVETPEDAKNFLENVPVFGMAIGEYFIKRKS